MPYPMELPTFDGKGSIKNPQKRREQGAGIKVAVSDCS